MISVLYTASFIKRVKLLETKTFEEVVCKVELFKNTENHKSLKVHKLHGKMKDFYSFSVNYDLRIVLKYAEKNKVILYGIGKHDMYK